MTLRQISRKIGMSDTNVSILLKKSGVKVEKNVQTMDKIKLGFHLHHRCLLPFEKSVALSGTTQPTLRKYFKEKKVRIRGFSFLQLSQEKQQLFLQYWRDDKIYRQKYDLKIPHKYRDIISRKMGDAVYCLYKYKTPISQMIREGLVPLSFETIRSFLLHNGIEIKDGTAYSKLYTSNEGFFSTIDTEEKSYWLGFLMGDGCVQGEDNSQNWRVSIGLQRRDRGHLVKFRKALESTHPIREYIENQQYPSCEISIQSRRMGTDLESKGVVRNKSLKARPPIGVPTELERHFIRGLFDADGSITKDGYFKICGTVEIVRWAQQVLGTPSNQVYTRRGLDNFAELSCGSKTEVLGVMDFIYKDATVYLDRKHLRYQKLKSKSKRPFGEGVETNETTA